MCSFTTATSSCELVILSLQKVPPQAPGSSQSRAHCPGCSLSSCDTGPCGAASLAATRGHVELPLIRFPTSELFVSFHLNTSAVSSWNYHSNPLSAGKGCRRLCAPSQTQTRGYFCRIIKSTLMSYLPSRVFIFSIISY